MSFLKVFHLPKSRIECHLKYALNLEIQIQLKNQFDPIVEYRPWLGHKKWWFKTIEGSSIYKFLFYAFFFFSTISTNYITQNVFKRWSRCTFLPKLATKEIRHVNKSLYIFKLTNKLGKIVWFVLFFQFSRIMKRFIVFYGGTKVKGNRDASFRRAVITEGARGG